MARPQGIPPSNMFSPLEGLNSMVRWSVLERAKWLVFEYFELLLATLLVAAMLVIHLFIDYKVAFLSFYYVPVIFAGFHLGRRGAVWSAVLSVALVTFLQSVVGLTGHPGLESPVLFTLVPWAGFLILTGYAVGMLADQRKDRLDDLKSAYMTMLELLTFHLESSERQTQGHSYRVAERAVALGRELGVRTDELEQLRVAALLHELGPHDPRLSRLFEQFPGDVKELPIATSMRVSLDIVKEYSWYHQHVSADFPVDALRITVAAKILAVADAFETLQMPSPNRPPFSPWSAVEEIERGAGQTFGTEVVAVLRRTAAVPERTVATPLSFTGYRLKVAAT
jgi:hypothetical protein